MQLIGKMSRVLSIQSHVVYGYVGNKAAVFPMQVLGFDVDVINSVHFSCHTGYPNKWEGTVLNGDQLRDILNGLQRNDLLRDTGHLLTGYIGSESFLRSVLHVLHTLQEQQQQQQQCDDDDNDDDENNNKKKKKKRNVRYVCDPVLGDDGELYVPEELVTIYRDEVLPLAHVCTPNQFEVELLTGISIQTLDDAKEACVALHDLGPDLVVITSMILPRDGGANAGGDGEGQDNNDHEDKITILASERVRVRVESKSEDGNNNDDGTTITTEDRLYCIKSPILKGSYTGTGDLFAALLLAWTSKLENNLPLALEKVVSTMYAIIKNTIEKDVDGNGNGNGNGNGTVKSRELQLIQSKNVIEDPPMLFQARRL